MRKLGAAAALFVFVALVPLLRAQPGPTLGFDRQVFVVNADGGGLRQLTSGKGDRATPTWSPDGLRLAYADKGIKVITLATGKTRLVLRGTLRRGPAFVAWSPTRDEILFRHTAGTEDRTRVAIAVITPDGRRVRRLVSWPVWRSELGGPAWAPNGRRIAYLREGKPISRGGPLGTVSGGNYDVHVMSRSGKGKHRVRLRGDERQPLWSPDGKWLLFGRTTGRSTAKDSKFGLWRMSPGGRRLQRVGPKLVNAYPFSWSHDGTRAEFTGHSDTGARDQALFVLDATPAGVPRVIAEHVGGSAWSPVANLIAFTDFDGHVRVTAPDGTGQRTFATFAPDTEFHYLSWSPDGKQLAFTAAKQRPSD